MAEMVESAQLRCQDLASLDSIATKAIEFAGDRRVWLIEGDMGAGKTTFIKEICRQLGVSDTVASPTFSIVNEYDSTVGSIYHFDFYRINDVTEAIQIGCEEYFFSGHYCFIEWAEKIEPLLPDSGVIVRINVVTEEIREFQFNTYDRT
jgi:tRNA threonylcarbamoyladenosine biosynthesis protein TsaE